MAVRPDHRRRTPEAGLQRLQGSALTTLVGRRERLRRRYRQHHRSRRRDGEFVFVPERVPLLVEAVGGPDKKVLDLGCRTGAVTQHFLEGNTVVGVDVDREALAVAAERGIDAVWADIEQPLPFVDEQFDAVVAGEILEHVRSPSEFVGEIVRVLAPGGTLAGSVPNAYRLQGRLTFMRGRAPEDDPTHLHMYRPDDLRTFLGGLENVWLDYVGGRYRRLHPRLLARDIVFRATKPSTLGGG